MTDLERRQTLLLALLAAAAPGAWADGGQECLARRDRTAAEARQAQDIVAALKNALPDPPPSWQRVDVTEPRRPAAQVYAAPGCPESHSIRAVYRNDAQALAAAQARQADAARMDRLMAELQAAIGKGDAQRIKSLNTELERLQSGGAAAMLSISIQVNSRDRPAADGEGRPIAIAGAASARLFSAGAQPRVVMWLGAARAAQADPRAPGNAQAHNVVIHIDGAAAEDFARLVRLAPLQALLR